MDYEGHWKRAWGVFSSRWQEAVLVSVLPLAMLIVLPFIIMALYLVVVVLVVLSIVVAVALGASGVSNAGAWVFGITVVLFLAAGLAMVLLLLPMLALSFIVRAGVNPTLAQMMAGGKGGWQGFTQVLREDWAPLLLTDLAVYGPALVITGVVVLPLTMVMMLMGPFAVFGLCLLFPLILVVAAFNFVWMYLTAHATVLVRLEGLSPLAAVKASMALAKRRLPTLVIGFAAYMAVNMVAGQFSIFGVIGAQAVVFPLWILYNTSVYLEERDSGRGAREVESRYVVS